MLQHLIIQFPFYYLPSGCSREVKKFELLKCSQSHTKWLLTNDSKYSDLTRKVLCLENWWLR